MSRCYHLGRFHRLGRFSGDAAGILGATAGVRVTLHANRDRNAEAVRKVRISLLLLFAACSASYGFQQLCDRTGREAQAFSDRLRHAVWHRHRHRIPAIPCPQTPLHLRSDHQRPARPQKPLPPLLGPSSDRTSDHKQLCFEPG